MEGLDRENLLIALNKNNFNIFHYNENECYLSLKDDEEILLQLSDNSIPEERINLLKHILRNYETYIHKAVGHLKAFGIDMENNHFTYGVYVGEFKSDGHPLGIDLWFE